jgi:head-tail adaptor
MLNIGKLDIRGSLKKNTMAVNAYGQFVQESQTEEPIWLRKVIKKGYLGNDVDSLHNTKEAEFIIRFRTDIKLNDVISIPRFRSNASGDDREYSITDIEEIGRGEGLKIKTILNTSRNKS